MLGAIYLEYLNISSSTGDMASPTRILAKDIVEGNKEDESSLISIPIFTKTIFYVDKVVEMN